jgi:O-antigen/teichoic acid export membrane protein
MLRAIAPLGAWSAFGAGVHWLFSQGYNYLVAGILDVAAVAALSATRLLVMPVNLLSTGIATILFPTVSRWLHEKQAPTVFGRLVLVSIGLGAVASCFLLVIWLARDWIFSEILRKQFADRDLLLQLWFAIVLLMLFRDQLLHFLVAREKFRLTSTVTLVSAVISISISLVALRSNGVAGALVGLLAGELCNVAGIIFFSIRETRLTS